MQYMILCDSTKVKGEKLAFVNRSICKDQWWTQTIEKAKVYNTHEEASAQCAKLKFNGAQVWQASKAKVRLGQILIHYKIDSISQALQVKASQWHDDDWDEGKGDHG